MINLIKKIKSAVIVMASLVAFTTSTLAIADDDVLAGIIKDGVLKVAMSADQPPYNMKSRDKTTMGFDVDLANTFANAMRVKLEIVEVPFGELMSTLKSGKADMIISGMTITPKRSQTATFIGPYNISGKSILSTHEVMKKVADTGFNNEAIRVVVLENSTSQTMAEKQMPKAKIQTISNYEEGIQLIIAGKADALVADMPTCKLAVLRNPTSGLVTSKKPLSIEPIGIAIPLDNPQFQNLITNNLATFEKIGLLDGLQKKWFENSNWVIALP